MALFGPYHKFAVRMRIMGIIVPRMRTHVPHAYSQRPAPRVSTLVAFIIIGNEFSCTFKSTFLTKVRECVMEKA